MDTRNLIHHATRIGLAGAFAGAMQGAIIFNYADFSSVAGLTINGNAAQVGNVLRVTPAIDNQAGSVFSTTTVSLSTGASFSTFFQFRFTNPDVNFCDSATTCGADGIVFVVQTVANNVGGAGGGIGYQGIGSSVGIEFDNWNNGSVDGNSSNHAGVDVNGSINSVVRAEVTEADLNLGDIWNVWIDYNGTTDLLEARLTRAATRPAAALISHTIDLESVLGTTNAFVGFTSGTGGSHANHDVLSWVFDNSFAPIDEVPEPATFCLVGGALLLLGVRRARR
jgi:hypothetical protein